MPPSFLPSIPCKSPCPQNATQMPRPTVPREQELAHATCDAMRVRDARCAWPPFPSTPRYASCCALTPAGDSIRQNHSLSWYTKAPPPPCEDNITLGTSPLPRSKHLVPPTPSQGMSTRGGCCCSASPVTLGAAARSARLSRSRPGEGAVDTRLSLGSDFEVCESRLGQAAAGLDAFEDPILR